MFERFRKLFTGSKPKSSTEPKNSTESRAALGTTAYGVPTLRTLFNISDSGIQITEDTVVGWTAIWRGLQLVGSAIGSMPFTIQEVDPQTGNVRARIDHPLYSLINLEPHPFYSTHDYLQALIYQVILRGNAVAVIHRNGANNRPLSIKIVSWSDVVDVVETVDGRLLYKIQGYPEAISHEDVIHVKGLTKTGIVGLDALKWQKDSFAVALGTRRSALNYQKTGTHSDGFLTTEQLLKADVRRDLGEAWQQKTASGETPFLTGGVKWERMGITPREVQLLEARQFNVYEAARLIGVSPHLLYAMDRANFSNVETLSNEFAKYSLKFWVHKIELEHDRKIFRREEKGRVRTKLDMNSYLRGDTQARANYIHTLLDRGVLSIDEARQIEGFNTLEDEEGKIRFVPGGYQKLDAFSEKQQEQQTPSKTAREEEGERKIDKKSVNGFHLEDFKN